MHVHLQRKSLEICVIAKVLGFAGRNPQSRKILVDLSMHCPYSGRIVSMTTVRPLKVVRRVPLHAKAIKITITCPPMLYEVGKRMWEERGYRGPAAYFQAAIRKDAKLEIA